MTGERGGERVVVISADGHAGAPMREYRPYLEAEFRDDFDTYASEYETRMGGWRITPPKHFFNPKVIEPYEERMIASGAIDGEFEPRSASTAWSPTASPPRSSSPTRARSASGSAPPTSVRPMHARAAARAYNRWIVDFCAGRTDRLGGQALLTFLDIDEDLETIHAAAASGLKGLVIPGVNTTGRIPMLWDEALDPIWAAC